MVFLIPLVLMVVVRMGAELVSWREDERWSRLAREVWTQHPIANTSIPTMLNVDMARWVEDGQDEQGPAPMG
jgi:hypothetical protein